VSIALLRGTEPVLGVVLAPLPPVAGRSEDLIAWAEGCGPPTRNGHPIRRRWSGGLSDDTTVLLSVGSDRRSDTNTRRVSPARFRAVNSVAYRLALVAAGEGEVGVSLAGATDYDFAAADALLRATGGVLVDAAGQPIAYAPEGGGHVDTGGRCLGGGSAAVSELVGRDWTPREEAPIRGLSRVSSARIFRGEPTQLGRAQGLLLGQLLADSWLHGAEPRPTGRTGPRSQVALLLARTVRAEGGYAMESAADAYAEWFRSGPQEVEAAEAPAFRAGAAADPEEVGAAMRVVAARARGTADGPLLRGASLALLGEAATEAARWDAELTHATPSTVAATQTWVAALAALVAGRASPPPDRGPAATAVQAQASTLDATLRAAASAGGPVAAVLAGAWYGASRGADALPSPWVDRILTWRPGDVPAERWAVDVLVLAEHLLAEADRISYSV
jgi:hypothetical protein